MQVMLLKKAQDQLNYLSKTHQFDILKKINKLLEDIKLHPYSGLGKPEALKFELSGYLSRRITMEYRLVYKIEEDAIIIVASCLFHY